MTSNERHERGREAQGQQACARPEPDLRREQARGTARREDRATAGLRRPRSTGMALWTREQSTDIGYKFVDRHHAFVLGKG